MTASKKPVLRTPGPPLPEPGPPEPTEPVEPPDSAAEEPPASRQDVPVPPVEPVEPKPEPRMPVPPRRAGSETEERMLDLLRRGQITLTEAVEVARSTPGLQKIALRVLLNCLPGMTKQKTSEINRIALTGTAWPRRPAVAAPDDLIAVLEQAMDDPERLWSPWHGWPWQPPPDPPASP